MSLLLLLQSLQSPTSGTSALVNPYSFNGGFNGGFETQNKLLLSSTYNVEIPLVYSSASGGMNIFPTELSATYATITPSSFIQGQGFVNTPNPITGHYNLVSPIFITEGKGYTVSASTISANYNLQTANISIHFIVPADILNAIYNVNSPSIVEGYGVNAFDYNPLSASYSLKNVSVIEGTGITSNVNSLTANYALNSAQSDIEIRVSAVTLSSNYNINQIQIVNGSGNTVSANELDSTYSINSTNVKFGSTISPSTLSADYAITTPSILGASIVLPNILSATYNQNGVTIKASSLTFANILSAFYTENQVGIIEGLGLITSAGILSAQYNLSDVSISSTIKNSVEALSAIYSSSDVTVIGNAKTYTDPLSSTYELQNTVIYVQTVVTGDILNVTYNIEDANIFVAVNYTFSADVCSASYNLNNPEVIIALPEWINDPQVPSTSYWRDDTECKDNERFLYNSLLTNSNNMFAPIWQYYPTTYNLITDRVFKEDSNRMVIRSFSASGMIEDIPPEHRSYKLEGLVGNDIVRAWFSVVHFTEASTYSGLSPNIYPSWSPAIGDYLYLTSNGLFYEVINVNDAIELFLNRQHNWELVMRVYRDNKLTVSAGSPTLVNDVILQVCTSAASATTQFNDYLEINEDINDLITPIEYDEQTGEQPVNPFGGW